jgi:Flp pilus assembly pilin Flp
LRNRSFFGEVISMNRWRKLVTDLHRDERGTAGPIANLMMLAVAALLIIALLAFGREVMNWLKGKWSEATGG